MTLAATFKKWLVAGQPSDKRGQRDLSVPNAITSVQWNKLVTHARNKTMTALGKELEEAASKHMDHPKPTAAQRKAWKTAAAGKFFFTLSAELQDGLTPAGPALRSGLMDAAAAAVLGVEWTPPPQSEASASSCFPITRPQAAVPGVGKRLLAKELADRLLAEAGNGQDALEVLASIQRRVARQLPEWRETEDCNQCGRVAPARRSDTEGRGFSLKGQQMGRAHHEGKVAAGKG